MAPPAKFPWAQIEAEYVHGIPHGDDGAVRYPTYDELAERHGARADLVRRRGGKGRWTDKRSVAQAELERARREARAKDYLAAAERIDGRSLQVAEQGMQLVHARIQELITVQGERLTQMANGVRSGLPAALDSMELTRLSLAGIRWHQLAMRAVGQEAERGGMGATPTDAGDLAAVVITERERELAAVVGSKVRAALNAASRDVSPGQSPDDDLPPPPPPVSLSLLLGVPDPHTNGHADDDPPTPA